MAKAVLIQKSRAYVRDGAFIEMLIWRVPEPVEGSGHFYKYSLALVSDGACVLRFDNEAERVITGIRAHVNCLMCSSRWMP
jgi:hypothetical protein